MGTITDILSSLTPADRTRVYAVAGYLALKPRCERTSSDFQPTRRLPQARKMPPVILCPEFDLQATKRPTIDLNIRKRP